MLIELVDKFLFILGSDFSNGTPGPAHYYYEKYENKYKNQVPAYSIGKAQRFPTIIV